MKILMRSLPGFTKKFSDQENMWVIFGAMWTNMVLMILSLLIRHLFYQILFLPHWALASILLIWAGRLLPKNL